MRYFRIKIVAVEVNQISKADFESFFYGAMPYNTNLGRVLVSVQDAFSIVGTQE